MEETRELAVVSERVKDNNEIEVSASDKGVSLKAKGPAASRLGHSFADLMSPFSNLAGLGGDKLRHLRIYQEIAFRKTLEEAYNIAIESGIDIKPVSTKIMVAIAEGSSMEDVESDDSLYILWANLLVNVSQSEPAEAIAFTKILSQISGVHARLLKKHIMLAPDILSQKHSISAVIKGYRVFLESLVDQFAYLVEQMELDNPSNLNEDQFTKISELLKPTTKNLDSIGVILLGVTMNDFQVIPVGFGTDNKLIDYEILDKVGLMDLSDISGITKKGNRYLASVSKLTELGLSFFKYVSSPKNDQND